MEDDPLEDRPCGCDKGWRTVGEAYINDIAPDLPEDLRAQMRLNTVYPCKRCQPTLFFRWVGGHLDPEHDRHACEECREAGVVSSHHYGTLGNQRRATMGAADRPSPAPVPAPLPLRADVDG